jgi:molecular chaperone GrpE
MSQNEQPEAAEPDAAASADLVKELAAKDAENKLLYDQLLRLKAEFENYRKRVDREKPDLVRYGRTQLLEKLLPLYDVLLSAHEQLLKAGAPASELAKGLELIFKEFTKLFQAEGVASIDSVGKPYDFDKHEVMGQVESEQPAGTVVEELQRGYTFEGKVLRPAKVKVAKEK